MEQSSETTSSQATFIPLNAGSRQTPAMSLEDQLELLFRKMAENPAMKAKVVQEVAKESSAIKASKRALHYSKVRVFKTVTLNINCTHCKTKTQETKTLEADAGLTIVAKDGSGIRVSAQKLEDGCEVNTYVTYCDSCGKYISALSREELEQRYLLLISTCSLSLRVSRYVHQENA